MRVRGFNNVGRAAQTDPKLLCYASTITKQKKCWELLAQKFHRFEILRTRNNMQQGGQTDATCIIQQFDASQESCVRLHGALHGKRDGKHRITGLTRQKDSVKCSTYKGRFWPSFRSLWADSKQTTARLALKRLYSTKAELVLKI